MKPPVARQSLDRQDLSSCALKPENKTGNHGLAIQKHSTGATFSQLASMLRSRVAEIFAQNLKQCFIRREGNVHFFTVQREPDLRRLLRFNRECRHSQLPFRCTAEPLPAYSETCLAIRGVFTSDAKCPTEAGLANRPWIR